MKFPLSHRETKRSLLEGTIIATLGIIAAWPLGFGFAGYFVVVVVGFVITSFTFVSRMRN